ncbi:hypothetical protein RB200_05010 [Streptomyces sp. PmtG]
MGWVEWLVFGVVCLGAAIMLLGTIALFDEGHPFGGLLVLLLLAAGGWYVFHDWPLTWQEAAFGGAWPAAAFFVTAGVFMAEDGEPGWAAFWIVVAAVAVGAHFAVPHYVEGAKGTRGPRSVVASQRPSSSPKPSPKPSPKTPPNTPSAPSPSQSPTSSRAPSASPSRTPSPTPTSSPSPSPNRADPPGPSPAPAQDSGSAAVASGRSFPEQWGPWMSFVGGGAAVLLAGFQIHEIIDRRRERRAKN